MLPKIVKAGQCICMLITFLLVQSAVIAQVRLPRLVRDSMVLQRGRQIHLWGWSAPNEQITIRFAGKKQRFKADDRGNWSVYLPASKAGGPYEMNIDASNHILLRDILIGDVWLCSGQSNMEHQLRLHDVRYADEIANAHYSEIRQFGVPNVWNFSGPQQDLSGGYWKCANPEDVKDFSAVAYFFAKSLYDKYHVPIGIINASWGGTPVESWMSETVLEDFPEINSIVQRNKDTNFIEQQHRDERAGGSNHTGDEDKGLTGAVPWYSEAYTPLHWRTINIPGYWEDQGVKNLDGVVWYRREIDIPSSYAGKAARIFLGRIVDADEVYINGKKIGNTTYLYPQRRYVIPEGVLKSGKNLFVIRVTNTGGKGGFVPDKPYELLIGKDTIDLKGYWEYKVGQIFTPRPPSQSSIVLQYQPACLYNAMIAPLTHFPVKGFVWYQGESNTGHPEQYTALQNTMMMNWRKDWRLPTAPFLYVQLPGFMDMNYLPEESRWAQFREAQRQSLKEPHTGMAVTIDLGEWNDIHPDRKKEVGERLALLAERIAYGENIVSSGPLFQSATIEGNKMVLSFTDTGSGLETNDGEAPTTLAIAGADKKFVWAKAKIDNNKLIVWNDSVAAPRYVRYAWADDPVDPNLYNKEGLPASPFSTEE